MKLINKYLIYSFLWVIFACKKSEDPKPNGNTVVAVTFPSNNFTTIVGSNLSIEAQAASANSSVTVVKFYANGSKIGESVTSPYTITWKPSDAGTYNILASAHLASGDTVASSTVAIVINPAPDYNALITAKNWKLTALTVDPARAYYFLGPEITNWYAQMKECETDNIYTFNSNGSFSIDEGASKCDTDDPQTRTGTWVFNPEKTIYTTNIKSEAKSYKISQLNSNQLIVTYTQDALGTEYTYTATYAAQ